MHHVTPDDGGRASLQKIVFLLHFHVVDHQTRLHLCIGYDESPFDRIVGTLIKEF